MATIISKLDGFKMKIGSLILALYTFLQSFDPNISLGTVGDFTVTIGSIQSLMGALGLTFFGWGAASKGDKIIAATKNKQSEGQ